MRLLQSFLSILAAVFLVEAQIDSSQSNNALNVQSPVVEPVLNTEVYNQTNELPKQSKENFAIDWSTIPEDQKINLILSSKGIQISTKKDEDDDTGFVIEWENNDYPEEDGYNKRSKVFANSLRSMKGLKFYDKLKIFNIGIGYRFSFLAATDNIRLLMNTYSVDVKLKDQHIISFMIGHNLGNTEAIKVRGAYEFQYLIGSGYLGAGFEIGALNVEKEIKGKYSYYSDTVEKKAILCPKFTMGLKSKMFSIGLEEKINFAPKFIHEVGVVVGFSFLKNRSNH
ncbi:MAG: hypothetical protein GX640_18570 [Fibrobacter sp.]|nr:hypothetical protein [Fibrobacter sp.]